MDEEQEIQPRVEYDRKKRKVNKHGLPKKLMIFPSLDKDGGWMEKWYQGRDLLDWPRPFRALLVARPGLGKGVFAANVVARCSPAIDRIIVVHPDSRTVEYDIYGDTCTVQDKIPHFSDFDDLNTKLLVIFDDVDFSELSRKEMKNLSRLLGYASTHLGICIIVQSQDWYNLPPFFRRMANIFVIWNTPDKPSLASIARRVGMKTDTFMAIFDSFKSIHTSLCIDLTENSPSKYRLDGYNVLKVGET